MIMSGLDELPYVGTEISIIKISSFTKYAFIIILILIIADISILFDIPIVRQVLGILLLLLPGLLFLRFLNLIIEDTIEKSVLTLGICISILLLIGLFFNFISLGMKLFTPLSTVSLVIMLNAVSIFFMGLQYGKKFSEIKLSFTKKRLNIYDKFFLLIAILIPVLGFWGIEIMNKYAYNYILVALFIFVCVIIIIISKFYKNITSNIYLLIIFSISITFVLLYPLRSDHLLGMDIHTEYYLFQQTISNLNWQLTPDISSHSFQLLQPLISISLLPAIFQSILNINPETLIRLYIPIFFSITPLIVYIIAKRYLTEYESFLASIAFISYYAFFRASYYSRATFAILFFALFIMVLFNNTFHQNQKSVLLLLLSLSIIFTHYSSTFIFLFIVGSTSIISYLLLKPLNFERKLNITLIFTIIVFIFFWYSLIANGIFNISLKFVKSVLDIDNLYIEGAHSGMVSQLGGNIASNQISLINLINTWLFLFLIGFGILGLIIRSYHNWFESKGTESFFPLKKEFEPEFVVIAVLCFGTLAMSVFLPFLSTIYDLDRIYFLTSIILSIVFIYGAKCLAIIIKNFLTIIKTISHIKNRKGLEWITKLQYIIILIILIPHLLFTAFIPQVITGNADWIILNSNCPTYDYLYLHDSDESSMQWLDHYRMTKYNVKADYFGRIHLISYGNIVDSSTINMKSNNFPLKEYIYLRETNVATERIYYGYNMTGPIDDIFLNENINKLYSAPATILYQD
jgi:uncharacterized membrane protein